MRRDNDYEWRSRMFNKTHTRASLRRFWTKILDDLYNGRHISDARASMALVLAGAWSL